MSKIFTLLVASICFSSAWAGEQLLLVVSPDINSSTATMQRYLKESRWEKAGEPIPVTLGRNGLGWADEGEPLKMEGDGRSPAGIFEISRTFGAQQIPNSKMPYSYADETLICVDDVSDDHYNQLIVLNPLTPPKSYEKMRRDDEVYRNGAVIDYNTAGAKGRGSCIFIHLNHPDRRPTAGCTAMDAEPLTELLHWLDPEKEPMIVQIPKNECSQYARKFAGIECP